jgi:SEC-C motif-containing protein
MQEHADGQTSIVSTPDGRRLGVCLSDARARRDYLDARYSEGHYLQWPPPRNKPCWCGSGTKYKKCCGAL